ncbi:MAG TPA: hypothetical protein ENJ84_05440 [Gammaproteobacteria bacterium]|nr:hypothetical protein [Gammaproteobacteria bacterium]
MSALQITDLAVDKTLDEQAMAHVRGGLTANIANPQAGNQSLAMMGGFGVFALNMPISAPTTILTEVNPVININLDLANLIGSAQNGLAI